MPILPGLQPPSKLQFSPERGVSFPSSLQHIFSEFQLLSIEPPHTRSLTVLLAHGKVKQFSLCSSATAFAASFTTDEEACSKMIHLVPTGLPQVLQL